MTLSATAIATTAAQSPPRNSVRRQVRGSALLLAGRGFSLLINLATQVAIIRYLAKSDFGALAYAISIVEISSMLGAFGMDKAFSRFGAIYHERQLHAKLIGALVLSILVPLAIGIAMIAALYGFSEPIAALLALDPASLAMLLALACLIPMNGFASVALSLITVLRGARAVFFRKHLLGPILKLTLVSGVIVIGGQPLLIAKAMLLAGLCSLLIDGWLTVRIVRDESLELTLWKSWRAIPVREFFSFSLPVICSDIAFLTQGTLMVMFVGWLSTADATASFRAVLPLVRLNDLVLCNFMVMFMPLASRLLARGAKAELGDMYRRTNIWIMVLSFPIFAVCVALAHAVTVLMYGDGYADAAILLVILSASYFFQATFGFSGQLMKVLNLVRLRSVIDVVATVTALAAAWWLIPIYGALGAALAASIGIAIHTTMKTAAVCRFSGGMAGFQGVLRPYFITLSIAALLVAVSLVNPLGWISGGLLAVSSSLLVVIVCRGELDAPNMFPELALLPVVKRWFSTPARDDTQAGKATVEADASEDKPLVVAYMMSRFPKLTETFVLREMVAMERMGAQVEVFPLQRENTTMVHADALPYIERAHFTPWLSPAIVAANIRGLIQQPRTYLRTWWAALRANFGSRRYFAGAVLFFPKAVYLGRLMQQAGVDHLHAHFASHPAMVAWMIHQLTGIDYSFTAHGSDLHRDRHMLAEKVRDAAAVIAISDYNRRMILDECGASHADRVHVIHCGIDLNYFLRRAEPTDFDRGEGPFQFACVGTLHEVKGQIYLLQACAKVAEFGVDFICHFVGEGPDRAKLETAARELGINDRVRFHGRRTADQVRTLLQQIDLLVAPSVPTSNGRREGIPVVLMEALASGLAVVASELSGIPEIVIHEQTGLLTPPRDPDAIAVAIVRMQYDIALRQRLAEAGHQLVCEQFNNETNVAALLALIEQTAGRRRWNEDQSDHESSLTAEPDSTLAPSTASDQEQSPCLC